MASEKKAFALMLDPGLYAALARLAGGELRSVNAQIEFLLRDALKAARAQPSGGFNLDMWATVVNRDGQVCAVAFTGADRGSQWPGSRAISAQKANTANAFSLPVALRLSNTGFSSTMSSEAMRPASAIISMQSWASR